MDGCGGKDRRERRPEELDMIDKIFIGGLNVIVLFILIGGCIYIYNFGEDYYPRFSLSSLNISRHGYLEHSIPTYEFTMSINIMIDSKMFYQCFEPSISVYHENNLLASTLLYPLVPQKQIYESSPKIVQSMVKFMVDRPFKNDGIVDFDVKILAPECSSLYKKNKDTFRFLCTRVQVNFKNTSIGSMVVEGKTDCPMDYFSFYKQT